ncbi:hypothetical protein V1463_04605 [Micrococcus yunnanensis]|uniref:hypothetical protein n=1 Tax=Micrococcus yunnanensis TaxID=566027 RepID=UPI00300DD423
MSLAAAKSEQEARRRDLEKDAASFDADLLSGTFRDSVDRIYHSRLLIRNAGQDYLRPQTAHPHFKNLNTAEYPYLGCLNATDLTKEIENVSYWIARLIQLLRSFDIDRSEELEIRENRMTFAFSYISHGIAKIDGTLDELWRNGIIEQINDIPDQMKRYSSPVSNLKRQIHELNTHVPKNANIIESFLDQTSLDSNGE